MLKSGSIEVITGCMFAGKTEEFIRRVKQAITEGKRVAVAKPTLDNRYNAVKICSHNGTSIDAEVYSSVDDLHTLIGGELYADALDGKPHIDILAIDEAQFFNQTALSRDGNHYYKLPLTLKFYADVGIRVIVAGLDTDFTGKGFGAMPELLAIADDVTKLKAVCVVCGKDATMTQRLVDGKPARYDDQLILVGANECYEARCRSCHVVVR